MELEIAADKKGFMIQTDTKLVPLNVGLPGIVDAETNQI